MSANLPPAPTLAGTDILAIIFCDSPGFNSNELLLRVMNRRAVYWPVSSAGSITCGEPLGELPNPITSTAIFIAVLCIPRLTVNC
jgi:hypothetical protein